MSNFQNGSVDKAQTIKAGCGIRYDPEELSEECGFDFSKAEELKLATNDVNNINKLDEIDQVRKSEKNQT